MLLDIIITHLISSNGQTHTGSQFNPWSLIVHASFVVQLVIIVLALMSMACWFVIGAKLVRLSQATRASKKFLDAFWGKEEGSKWTHDRLEDLYVRIKSFDGSPLASVFRAGYVELARMVNADDTKATSADIDNIERALKRTAGHEMTALEMMLPLLATTGSTGPFIGLFGTVWGIMQSFIAIAGNHSASLDVVAPGIAEALIATAIGLVAAIPAVMAYNYFLRRIRVLESEVDAFSYDYLNIVRRHFLKD